ncbi:MAG: hypothetical protein ABI559_07915 [Chloroflexota bacterium]
MPSRVRDWLAATVVFALALTVACGGGDDLTPSTVTPTPVGISSDPVFKTLLSRPLNLPSASGGDCPVTPAELLSPTSPFTVGDGPIYTTGLGSSTVLNVKAGGDWLVGNLQWEAPTTFAEKALIRGGRIDGGGQVGFGLSAPRSNDPDRAAVELDPASDLAWSAEVFVKSPGCYALQIDSETSDTDVIVFHVAEVTQ